MDRQRLCAPYQGGVALEPAQQQRPWLHGAFGEVILLRVSTRSEPLETQCRSALRRALKLRRAPGPLRER
jgi:hypothetical protein